jgi:hypothetical protein
MQYLRISSPQHPRTSRGAHTVCVSPPSLCASPSPSRALATTALDQPSVTLTRLGPLRLTRLETLFALSSAQPITPGRPVLPVCTAHDR